MCRRCRRLGFTHLFEPADLLTEAGVVRVVANLEELRRLVAIWRVERAPGLSAQPSRANPSGFTDLDTIEAAWMLKGLDLRFRR